MKSKESRNGYVFLDIDNVELVRSKREGVLPIPLNPRAAWVEGDTELYNFVYFGVMYGEFYKKNTNPKNRACLAHPEPLYVVMVTLAAQAIFQGIVWDVFKEAVLEPFLKDKKTKPLIKKVTKKKTKMTETDSFRKVFEYMEETYVRLEDANENNPPYKKITKKITTTKK